jgi:hypothetical protein
VGACPNAATHLEHIKILLFTSQGIGAREKYAQNPCFFCSKHHALTDTSCHNKISLQNFSQRDQRALFADFRRANFFNEQQIAQFRYDKNYAPTALPQITTNIANPIFNEKQTWDDVIAIVEPTSESERLLGREVLNLCKVTFDGPKNQTIFH